MTVEFTPAQESQLIEAAHISGKSVHQVVTDAMLWIVEMERVRTASESSGNLGTS